jgi:hypothetical protein
MKKGLGMLLLISLFVFGMKPCAMAQDEVQIHINMFKDVSSSGEFYGISFDLTGDNLKKVYRVFIDGPRGWRSSLNNSLKLNRVLLSAVNLGIDEFNFRFPEGEYKISLSPPAFGKLKVQMTHDFPSTPVIIYPADGAVDVPLNPVITWVPLADILSLRLTVKDRAGLEFSIELPTDATSYSLPVNLLKPNTQYELSLQDTVTDFVGNELTTTKLTSFTTKAQ